MRCWTFHTLQEAAVDPEHPGPATTLLLMPEMRNSWLSVTMSFRAETILFETIENVDASKRVER